MATAVIKYFPEARRSELLDYVFPDEILAWHTLGDDGQPNRSILIKPEDDDLSAGVFDTSELDDPATREEAEAQCTHETLLESISPSYDVSVGMDDRDDGRYLLVVIHAFAASYN